MSKLLINSVFLTFPVLAQLNPLQPSKPMNIGETTAPPAVSRFEDGTRESGRTAPPGRTVYRWSIATVLAANAADVASSWNRQEANPFVAGGGTQCRSTLTGLSHRLLEAFAERRLAGNCSTFSIFKPQLGHRTRYSSMTTVVRYSKHARSRTSRSVTSAGSAIRAPQPEQISLRLPRFRRTHSFNVLAFSSISCWYTV